MADKPEVSYKRAPSEELLKLLVKEQPLSWLVDLGKIGVAGYVYDVHFRGDKIDVYRDGARLIRAMWPLEGDKNRINIEADSKYEKYGEGFFGSHSIADTSEEEFQQACKLYLCKVKLEPNQEGKEGAIQMKWSNRIEPWVPFDREVTLKNSVKKKSWEVVAAFVELTEIYCTNRERSGKLRWSKPSMSGNQVDRLAIDKEGRLVLLELKDASSSSSDKIYYSPFQLLQYIWEWHNVFQEVRCDLQALINARKCVGLTPKNVPHLAGGIRGAVGFGCKYPRSEKEGELGYKYRKVLEVVDRHLPPGVDPIETWAIGPYQPFQ